jgi:DNA-binding CsgD family transcriptional regulator
MDASDLVIAGLYKAVALPPGDWLFCQDKFTHEFAEQQPYCRDLLIPYGGRYSATMKVAQSEHETVLIALLSSLERGRFDEAQKAYLKRMGGHLVEAISRFRRVRSPPDSAPLSLWQAAFSLTRAEARVAAEVWAGKTMSEAAKTLSVAPSTVRTQLAQVFAKTRTSKQSELVRALAAVAGNSR